MRAAASVIVEKAAKSLAVLSVFIFFMFVPVGTSSILQARAKDLRIKTDMNQLAVWATIHLMENGDYSGLENNTEIKRIEEDITGLGGKFHINVSGNDLDYCARADFAFNKKNSWCVDSKGFSGLNKDCAAYCE
jgi:hypothetical protein